VKIRVAAGVALLVAAFLATELVLPRQAENRVRDELRGSARVEAVEVHAFPALKLLFGHADRVDVRVDEATAGTGKLAELLASTERTDELRATARTVRLGPLVMRDMRLRKDGSRLSGEAAITEADLAAALPPAVGLTPLAAGDGQLVLEAVAGPLSVRARLSARDGALVIAPDGLLGGFASLTVFSDRRVRVTGVGARSRADGFTVTATGALP
jgi:hypothetical protein